MRYVTCKLNDQTNHTHCDTKNFRMVSLVVVPVKSHLPDSECCFDGHGIIGVECSSRKVLIDMIHRRDHSGDAGCAAREEERCILENLHKQLWLVS